MMLMAPWLWWKEKHRFAAPLVGLLAIVSATFFSFSTWLFRSFKGDGSIGHLMFGHHNTA